MILCRKNCLKHKTFPYPIFYHFIQICLLQLPNENLTWCFQGSTAPIKTGPNTLRLDPHMMTLKSPPNNLYAPLSPINITTMIRQHAKFPPCTSKPVHEAIHYPTANYWGAASITRLPVTLRSCLILTWPQGHREPGNKVAVWIKVFPIMNEEL